MVTAKQFLDHVLPRNGWRVALIMEASPSDGKRPRIIRQQALPDNQQLADYLLGWDSTGFATYHACASFRNETGVWNAKKKKFQIRCHDNALATRSLWLDVDAGPGKPYPNRFDAAERARDFVRNSGLPWPVFVSSGNGLHLYWPLLSDVEPERWVALARGLRRLAAHHAFHTDPVRTADISSILRTPGTTNRKGAEVRPVLCERLDGPYRIEDFKSLEQGSQLGYDAPRSQPRPSIPIAEAPRHLQRNTPARISEASAAIGAFSPTSSNQIADCCEQVAQLRNRSVRREPVFHAILGVLAFASDGAEQAHRWSEGDPAYSYEDMQARIDRKKELSGATTCEHFHGLEPAICNRCLHFGKIKSPIVLGYEHGSTNGEATEAVPASASGGPAPDTRGIAATRPSYSDEPPTSATLPKLPDHFGWGKDLSLNFLLEQPDGQPIDQKISQDPIFLADVASAEKAGDYNFVFRQFLPTGWKTVTIPAATFIGPTGKSEMARLGANIHRYEPFVAYTREAWDEFRRNRKDTVRYDQYGWKDGTGAFLYGAALYTPAATINVSGSKEVQTRNQWIGPGCNAKTDPTVGLTRWRNAAGKLFQSGCEAQSVCLLASFAAPLMRFQSADEGGAIVSLVTRLSGTGKTTALAAAASVWGDRHGLSLTNDDNRVAKFLTLAALGNLPVVYDEIQTSDPMVVREFVINFTNGRDKQRGDRSGQHVLHSGTWQTILITASNASLQETLAHTSKADAPAKRVLEMSFEMPAEASTTIGDKLKNELIKNAGFAGEAYIKYLVKPTTIEWLIPFLADKAEEVQKLCNLRHEHRFWTRTISAIIVAGVIVHKLDLVAFDPDRIAKWMINKFMVNEDQTNADYDTEKGALNDLAKFIAHEQTNFMVMAQEAKGNIMHPQYQPRGRISGTFYNNTRTLIVSEQVMMDYALKEEIPFKETIATLKQLGVVTSSSKRDLTVGTLLPGAPIRTIVINMGHELMGNRPVMGLKPDDDPSNVTPMRRG